MRQCDVESQLAVSGQLSAPYPAQLTPGEVHATPSTGSTAGQLPPESELASGSDASVHFVAELHFGLGLLLQAGAVRTAPSANTTTLIRSDIALASQPCKGSRASMMIPLLKLAAHFS